MKKKDLLVKSKSQMKREAVLKTGKLPQNFGKVKETKEDFGKQFEAIKKTRPLLSKNFGEVNPNYNPDWPTFKKEWLPKEGEFFYIVASKGFVDDLKYLECPGARMLLHFGNYFRTMKAAKYALKEVKKLLKSLPRG